MKNIFLFLYVLVWSLFIAGFVFALMYFFNAGLDRQEVVDCNKMQSQSMQYSNFYLLQWQKDMCDAHNIIIEAPIQK